MLKSLVRKTLLVAASACLGVGLVHAADKNSAEIAKGEYLSKLGGCASCHTAPGKPAFSGGRELPTPFGSLYSTNITPDRNTGIGSWRFDDFWQAMHHGKGKNGELLYPAFPYTSYTVVTREDAKALYAYLRSVAAVEQVNQAPDMGFPYNVRSSLHVWRSLYFKPSEFKADNSKTEQWNRGAYLVQGLGHCNECHTTRNSMGAVDQSAIAVGGIIPGQDWYAPNLSIQAGGDLYGWTQQDIVDLLKTGMSSKGYALGPMAEFVHNSTQYMNDDDLAAVAEYLADIPAPEVKQVTVIKANDLELGKQQYQTHCAACHSDDGKGKEGAYPSLVMNPTVLEKAATNAIRVVLLGGFSVETQHNPAPYSMPSFAYSMSDEEITAALNYIRQSWGNNATAVQAGAVAKLRKSPIF